jgi:thioredoxin reductase/Pyruvate/2-oxoacid:ferredoxin oxidoreductase delta subunit
MLPESSSVLAYSLPLVTFWGVHAYARVRRHRLSVARRESAKLDGLDEPASLHPHVAPDRCLGCAACVRVCPEGDVLGLVHGKAELVAAGNCIGHGACAAACPTGAITLVFGTATRGIEIPRVDARFQSNVPGVYIVGELGGMGLIRNAVAQGCGAVEALASVRSDRSADVLDVVIVGAGPAGLAASLAARSRGLRFATLEQDQLGGAIAHYPRGKVVMTVPVELPLVGALPSGIASKEELLRFWRRAEERAQLPIHYGERVEDIVADGDVLTVRTNEKTYRARNVVLAIGRRGTPRKLGVAGEDRPKVVYRLIEARQYAGRRVLVVGGGDSAIEAAVAVAEQPGTTVTVSYRGHAFARAKGANRARIEQGVRDLGISVLFQSSVVEIGDDHVVLSTLTGARKLANDDVVVCAGGTLPTELLQRIGIAVDTKYGTP